MGVPTRSNTNQSVQSQKQSRSLEFWICVEEDLYYRVAKTKALISCAVTAKLICPFVFAYTCCMFSHVLECVPKVQINCLTIGQLTANSSKIENF